MEEEEEEEGVSKEGLGGSGGGGGVVMREMRDAPPSVRLSVRTPRSLSHMHARTRIT